MHLFPEMTTSASPSAALIVILRFSWKNMVLDAALIDNFGCKCCIFIQENTVNVYHHFLDVKIPHTHHYGLIFVLIFPFV